MTADKAQQPEYIITAELLKQIKELIFHEDEVKFEKIAWKILSHPITASKEPEMVFPHCIHGVFDESELRTHCLKDSGTCLDWRKCEGRVPRPHTPAPELTKMLLRSCFGDFEDCPCDDECVVSEYCAKYHEDHEKNSCGMTSSQCGFVQEHEKAEAARAATLAAYKKVLDDCCKECPIKEELPVEDYCAESCEGCLVHKTVDKLRQSTPAGDEHQ